MGRYTKFLIFFLFTSFYSKAQDPVVFLDVSSRMESQIASYLAVAFCDVNGDYRDDLIRTANDSLYVDININKGEKFQNYYKPPIFENTRIWTMNIGDINNDYFNDIIFAGGNTGIQIHSNQSIIPAFNLSQEINSTAFAQGSSMNDIDLDGKLDFLLSNDVASNLIFINEGDKLEPDNTFIDFNTNPMSDNSGNYSAIWFDADQDLDLDLFISKCRTGVDDPADPRRINMLFIKEGTNYIESALDFGLASGIQTWAADSGDLDNDGDIDLFLINHGAPHEIMLNNGDGTFVSLDDFTNEGTISGEELQTSLADLNNDGYLDVVVAGINDYILLNKGDLTFLKLDTPFGSRNAASFALGDMNDDGYIDACLNYGGGNILPDELWINLGGPNNRVSFSLNGNESNRSSIGAQIKLFGEWGTYTKWLKSGVAYGITNTLNIHFGMDEYTEIDSVQIYWPSGQIDIYENVLSNNHYVVSEGECIDVLYDFNLDDFAVCEGDELEIVNDPVVIWSNGQSGDEYSVQSSELIFATNLLGVCHNVSPLIDVELVDDPVSYSLTLSGEYAICLDENIEISTNQADNINWFAAANESVSTTLNASGTYFIINENECGVVFSDTLILKNVEFQTITDTIYVPGQVQDFELFAEGDSVVWFSIEDGNTIELGSGNSLTIDNIDSDTVFYFQEYICQDTLNYINGPLENEFVDSFPLDFLDPGNFFFTIIDAIHLESFVVNAQVGGIREFRLLNINDSSFFWSDSMALEVGRQNILLNIDLSPGTYLLTTNEQLNQSNLNTSHPGLKMASSSLIEKYSDLPYMQTFNTNSNNYFAYFEWAFYPLVDTCCVSDTSEIFIIIDTTLSTNLIDNAMFKVYPNPSTNELFLKSEFNFFDYKIFNLDGQMSQNKIGHNSIEPILIDQLSQGVYFVHIRQGDNLIVTRFVKL